MDRTTRTDKAAVGAGRDPELERRPDGERTDVDRTPPSARVREEDLEPHEGLRYIALLFKALAILLAFLLVAEIIVGLRQEGTAALMTILVEGTRIVVFAGLLWAAGDLAVMLIESNHDLRAVRILLGRLNGRMDRLTGEPPAGPPPVNGPRTSPPL